MPESGDGGLSSDLSAGEEDRPALVARLRQELSVLRGTGVGSGEIGNRRGEKEKRQPTRQAAASGLNRAEVEKGGKTSRDKGN